MTQYVPDWSSGMGDAFATFNGGDDDGLMELLWCNGHVVMQSQAPRKPARPEKVAPPPAAPMHYLQGMGFYQQQQSPALPPPPPPAVPATSLPAATARTSPPDGTLHKKYENCGKTEIQGITS